MLNWTDTSLNVAISSNVTSRAGDGGCAGLYQPWSAIQRGRATDGCVLVAVLWRSRIDGHDQRQRLWSNSKHKQRNFNGVTAPVTSWSDSEIQGVVPANATTGNVGVTVAGLTAQTAPFEIASATQLTDSAGNVTNYLFAMEGGVWHTVQSQGSGCSSCTVRGLTQEDYDGTGNMLDEIDANNHKITYAYDANGNLLSQSEFLDGSTNVSWGYTYNSFGEVLTATDPLGNVTTNTNDAHGNLLTVTTPKPDANTTASMTQFGYNALGELTSITDPLTHVTTLTYTPAGLIQTITDAQSNVTTYGYDAHGNRTSVLDAMNHEGSVPKVVEKYKGESAEDVE